MGVEFRIFYPTAPENIGTLGLPGCLRTESWNLDFVWHLEFGLWILILMNQVSGDPRHTTVSATVAAVRPWRGSRAAVARSPKPGTAGASCFSLAETSGSPPTNPASASQAPDTQGILRRRSETFVYSIFYRLRQGAEMGGSWNPGEGNPCQAGVGSLWFAG